MQTCKSLTYLFRRVLRNDVDKKVVIRTLSAVKLNLEYMEEMNTADIFKKKY